MLLDAVIGQLCMMDAAVRYSAGIRGNCKYLGHGSVQLWNDMQFTVPAVLCSMFLLLQLPGVRRYHKDGSSLFAHGPARMQRIFGFKLFAPSRGPGPAAPEAKPHRGRGCPRRAGSQAALIFAGGC